MLKSKSSTSPNTKLRLMPFFLLQVALLIFSVPHFVFAANKVVGEVIFTKGAVTASQQNEIRFLSKGESLFKGDTIDTGESSYTIFKLNDGGKMTLRPGTSFTIEEFEHDQGEERGLFNLMRGGFRTVTGLISKINPKGMTISTPVASIGIRGTDFDARLCEGNECNDSKSPKSKESYLNGLYVSVYDGKVALTNDAGVVILDAGNAGYVQSLDSQPVELDVQPLFQTQDPLPQPSKIDESKLSTLQFMIEEISDNPSTQATICKIK